MYLVDANILVYATNPDSAENDRARTWLDGRLAGHPQSVGLAWSSLLVFLRLATNGRIYPAPLAIKEAWGQVEDWLAQPAAWVPVPTVRHQQILGEIVRAAAPVANLVPDAHLAGLAQEHGLTVATADRGFGRFPGVRWVNPLEN